jgi:hypothetical protein
LSLRKGRRPDDLHRSGFGALDLDARVLRNNELVELLCQPRLSAIAQREGPAEAGDHDIPRIPKRQRLPDAQVAKLHADMSFRGDVETPLVRSRSDQL